MLHICQVGCFRLIVIIISKAELYGSHSHYSLLSRSQNPQSLPPSLPHKPTLLQQSLLFNINFLLSYITRLQYFASLIYVPCFLVQSLFSHHIIIIYLHACKTDSPFLSHSSQFPSLGCLIN